MASLSTKQIFGKSKTKRNRYGPNHKNRIFSNDDSIEFFDNMQRSFSSNKNRPRRNAVSRKRCLKGQTPRLKSKFLKPNIEAQLKAVVQEPKIKSGGIYKDLKKIVINNPDLISAIDESS